MTKQKILYDVLSPDGFPIRAEGPFKTRKERKEYLDQWVLRFKDQGYYSSVDYGRIPFKIIKKCCDLIEVPNE